MLDNCFVVWYTTQDGTIAKWWQRSAKPLSQLKSGWCLQDTAAVAE